MKIGAERFSQISRFVLGGGPGNRRSLRWAAEPEIRDL